MGMTKLLTRVDRSKRKYQMKTLLAVQEHIELVFVIRFG